MNDHTPDRVHDERLSAYLDGELNPAETREFEKHLESSETTRRALDDLRAVSAYLSDLPTDPAPVDLRTTVLSPQPTPQPVPRSVAGGRFRPTVMVATAVAVMALVVVAVLPGLLDNPEDHGDDLAMATAERDTPIAEGIAPTPFIEFSPESAASTDDGSELVFDKKIDKAQVGQIFSAIETTGDQAVVIRLTVVDIEQGLNSLRLLLQKHQIHRADIKARSATRVAGGKPGGIAEPRRVARGQLVSVVVKASRQQVSEAMAQLQREVQAQMEIPGILQVSTLETAPGGRQALDQLQSYGSLPAKGLDRFRVKGKLPPSLVANSAVRKPSRDAAATVTRPDSPSRPLLASVQVRLDLPADMLRKVRKPRARVAESQRKRSSAAPAAGRDPTDRRLQVVFVLVAPDSPSRAGPSNPDGAA